MWKGKVYKFCVLPNGLSPCSRWFTKLLEYPMENLRELMHILSSYIDDIFARRFRVRKHAKYFRWYYELGFTLHPDKCQLIPSTKVKTLGFIVNSVEMRVTLTQDKTESISSLLKHNIKKNVIKIRELARIVGKLVAASMCCSLHFVNLEKDKTVALEKANGNYEVIQLCVTHPSNKCNGEWKIYRICSMSSIIRPLQHASIMVHQI